MKKNKIITFILAAMMMASLAIPASAAEVEPDTTAQNETTVKFSYTAEDIGPGTTNVYTIVVPAEINLDTIDADGDGNADTCTNGGVAFAGKDEVKVTGIIGEGDTITVNVRSANDYYLTGADKVPYTMKTALTTECKNADGYDAVMTVEGSGEQKTDTSYLTFANVEGKGATKLGDYTDTLTFTYTYNDDAGAEENFTYAQ